MISYRNKNTRVVGSISGFDVITTNQEDGELPKSDHSYTEEDLFLMLKKIKTLYDPERLDELEAIITAHIEDMKNPHRTDLEKMGTSFIQELYVCWLDHGHVGSREEFLKQLFQYVSIADIETTLDGLVMDQVTSVKGVAAVVNRHNLDPEAHEGMLSKLFPGEEVIANPTLAIHGYIGLPKFVNVVRKSPMYVMNKSGFLKLLPEDTLESDFTYTDGTFPIFAENKNLLKDSQTFDDTTKYTVTNATIAKSAFVASLKDPNDKAYFLQEPDEVGPNEHILKPVTAVPVQKDKSYNVSFYVYPIGRTCCGIRIPTALIGNTYSFVHFDLATEQVFINDTVDKTRLNGNIVKTISGWYRCYITVTPTADGSLIPEFYPLDIYDGDVNYNGVAGAGICVFGCQVSYGILPPPYIESLGTEGTLAATTVTVPRRDWYKETEGTIVMELTNITKYNKAPDNREAYTIGDGILNGSLNGRFPPNNTGRFYFTAYRDNNQSLYGEWSDPTDRDFITVVQSYSHTHHLVGYYSDTDSKKAISVLHQINPTVSTLYLGCSRYSNNQLDGYVKSFVYYPNLCSSGNINFFLGE